MERQPDWQLLAESLGDGVSVGRWLETSLIFEVWSCVEFLQQPLSSVLLKSSLLLGIQLGDFFLNFPLAVLVSGQL